MEKKNIISVFFLQNFACKHYQVSRTIDSFINNWVSLTNIDLVVRDLNICYEISILNFIVVIIKLKKFKCRIESVICHH